MIKKIIILVLIVFFGQCLQMFLDYNRLNNVEVNNGFDSMYCETLQRNGQDCTQAWK